MSKLRFFAVFLMVSWIFVSNLRAEEAKIRVLALSATSSKDPWFDLTSLLDSSAKQGWKPGIAGTGAEEGIWIRFEKPVNMDAVALHGKGDFNVSMNGVEANENEGYFYVPDKMKVQTLFIHVSSHPTQQADLKGIKLCRKGAALPVQKPVMISGSAQAHNVLSPELAYGPFRLFDSRPDLAFGLDGSKIDPKKPVYLFDLALKNSVSLKGFFIWNGYQRSDELYAANSRPKVITVHNGGSSIQYTLKDSTGPQWFAFPGNGWNTSSLSFEADEVIPGKESKDLLVSEICFVTDKDEILMVKIPAPSSQVPAQLSKVVDQSLTAFTGPVDQGFSLKFRSDGTFAAFQVLEQVQGGDSRKIWEGNWVPVGPDKIKVFGKVYSSEPSWDGATYGVAVSKASVKTFQTTVQVTDLSHPSAAEKDRIFKYVMQAAPGEINSTDAGVFWKDLSKRKVPVFVESNLFSQVVVLDEIQK